MILGVGVDLVEIPRLERAMQRWGDRLLRRLFTAGELEICAQRARPGECLAARFAAKEAFLKALRTGASQGIRWTDVEVENDSSGAPGIAIHGQAREVFRNKGMERIWVSISHSGAYSLATVMIEG